ncbi:histidine phosphatase family protein [Roseateles chitosanitabidus]|jgi:probable phosphoglycerate mutase|uniref:histidine phosphatase family protein n=1 Tax=Roseateles chitosanitabidus TaxID=65048 RepID=UPI000A033880|nr:histidine phosphatase family protein [Roseateles chitosanitabidus]MBO9686799.1 histidine phosphatase family protein [Roseateles chitosanitabidus]
MSASPASLAPADDAGRAAIGAATDPTLILAIRHGETAWNREGRLQGHLNLPLNALGERQAERLGAALADQPIDAIYSSDLDRAAVTARHLAAPHGLEVRLDQRLRERAFGIHEGKLWTEIEAESPEDALRWRRRDPSFGPPGGESLDQLSARVVAVVSELAAAHAGQTIAVVAHGGVLDALYRAATRIDLQAPRSWVLGNASVNRLLYSPQGFTLVGWNDDQHLHGLTLDDPGVPGFMPSASQTAKA